MSQPDPGAEAAHTSGFQRSPLWPAVQARHLAGHPDCAACARPGAPVQVHHIFPFHFCIALGRPDLELDPRNLITLCQSKAGVQAPDHHLLVGHLASFQSANLSVSQEADGLFHGLTAAQLEQDPGWRSRVQTRLAPLEQLTPAERTALRAAMDRRFPPLPGSIAP